MKLNIFILVLLFRTLDSNCQDTTFILNDDTISTKQPTRTFNLEDSLTTFFYSDTLKGSKNVVIEYNTKEIGQLVNNKKEGIWKVWPNSYYYKDWRNFHYELLYISDSIVGPYTLYSGNIPIFNATLSNDGKWDLTLHDKPIRASMKTFEFHFLLFEQPEISSIRAVREYEKYFEK